MMTRYYRYHRTICIRGWDHGDGFFKKRTPLASRALLKLRNSMS